MRFTIHPEGPFDLYLGLKDLTRQPFGLTERLQEKRYQTLISNQFVTVFQKNIDSPLVIKVDEINAYIEQTIIKELTHRFGLKQNIKQFYQFLEQNTHLCTLTKKLYGLRMFQKSSPFEALVTAMTDQQLNVSFATTLKYRLITHLGSPLKKNNFKLWTFPTPKRLADLPEDALRPLQYSNLKSRYIICLAKGIVSGKYPINCWKYLSDHELIKALMSIYGVGRWTAEYAAMVGFNRIDLVPAADIGLQNAIQRCYHLKERPSEVQVRKIAKSWKPWRGLVTYYLWHAFE